jgi:rhodanese-related sulfurtransferase
VPYKTITMPEAAKLMDSEKGYVIVDVRTPAEYKEAHIPGAINIPLDTIGDNRISQLQKRDQMIMVYCRTGVRSRQASEKLMNKGYTNVVNIGGITSWTGRTVSGNK